MKHMRYEFTDWTNIRDYVDGPSSTRNDADDSNETSE